MNTDERRAIAEAARQGEWTTSPYPEGAVFEIRAGDDYIADCPWGMPDIDVAPSMAVSRANARHIATFDPPTILAWLDRTAALEDRIAALEAGRSAEVARVVERCAKRAHEELYPTNPEYDWTPYAKYMASAAQRAENAIRALDKQEPGS